MITVCAGRDVLMHCATTLWNVSRSVYMQPQPLQLFSALVPEVPGWNVELALRLSWLRVSCFSTVPSCECRDSDSVTHNDTPQSVGLLWTSDRPDAQTSTSQHPTLTTLQTSTSQHTTLTTPQTSTSQHTTLTTLQTFTLQHYRPLPHNTQHYRPLPHNTQHSRHPCPWRDSDLQSQ